MTESLDLIIVAILILLLMVFAVTQAHVNQVRREYFALKKFIASKIFDYEQKQIKANDGIVTTEYLGRIKGDEYYKYLRDKLVEMSCTNTDIRIGTCRETSKLIRNTYKEIIRVGTASKSAKEYAKEDERKDGVYQWQPLSQ